MGNATLHAWAEHEGGKFSAATTINGETTRIVWHGGEYIELLAGGDDSAPAFHVWNVWDYERSEPSFPRNFPSFRSYVRERLLDSDECDEITQIRANS